MKCIKTKDNTIERLSDHIADEKIKKNDVKFISKKEWKDNGRPNNKGYVRPFWIFDKPKGVGKKKIKKEDK